METKNMKCLISIFVIGAMFVCSTALAYIGNRNTGKFHHDNCSSVHQMADRNKVYIQSRAEAIASGYVPRKRCRP